MTLDADYLETLLVPVAVQGSRMCRLNPRPNIAIIKEFASNSTGFGKSIFQIPGERERSRSPKIKQIAVDGDDDAIYGLECPTDESFRNFLNSPASGSGTDQADPPGFDTFENFFDFGRPSIGLHLMTEALKASHTEARTTIFKAEVVEKEIVRLKDEVEANSLCEKELAVRETRRAYRKGKKDVADICRGAVGGLYLPRAPEYSYEKELAKQTSRMHNNADMASVSLRWKRGVGISGLRSDTSKLGKYHSARLGYELRRFILVVLVHGGKDQDMSRRIHTTRQGRSLKQGRQYSLRDTQYSPKRPKGGKHGWVELVDKITTLGRVYDPSRSMLEPGRITIHVSPDSEEIGSESPSRRVS
ncbi:hypothetical protein F2Q69_00030274 [Brassica cretica]|uniref:Uncharacterized protein n=1 Tax=Brassica cretica TaxID=69181 RepID=A0A8S9SD85_BRACR|nr:hypothetical protein F2Q69_00030274 [Brassica cretica]